MTWAGVPYLSLTISKTVWPFLVVDPAVNCLNIDMAVLKHLIFFSFLVFEDEERDNIRDLDFSVDGKHCHQSNLYRNASGVPEWRCDSVEVTLGSCPDNGCTLCVVYYFSSTSLDRSSEDIRPHP